MTELEKYYLDKERKTAITKQAEEKAKVSIYNRIISETKPYILTEYKKNPPEYYSWLNVNGKKTLVWRFDGYIRRGRDDSDSFSWFLDENGNIYQTNTIYSYEKRDFVSVDSQNVDFLYVCSGKFAEVAVMFGAPKNKLIEWGAALNRDLSSYKPYTWFDKLKRKWYELT